MVYRCLSFLLIRVILWLGLLHLKTELSMNLGGVTDGVTDRVTDAEKKILDELIKDPGYSYVNIANNLGISKKPVAERIKSLKDKGIVVRVGNNKNGYWKIK